MLSLLHTVQDNVWAVFLIAFFFGGSIFVHEMGHFLAARANGLKVERFSIGFGPAIWSHLGKDGVEYRLSWFPLGGYVLLPQLADLGAIEGKSAATAPDARQVVLRGGKPIDTETAELPPVAYVPKMIVFVAGACFNVLFALALASIISAIGIPVSTDQFSSTTIGMVSKTVELADGTSVPSPAVQAGLQAGDVVRSIDGKSVSDWSDIASLVVLSGGRDAAGHPEARFQVERAGKLIDVVLHPRLSGPDSSRQVGISQAFTPIVHEIAPGYSAAKAGFQDNDQLDRIDGVQITSIFPFLDELKSKKGTPVAVQVLREGKPITLTITPIAGPKGLFGFTGVSSPTRKGHPSPFKLVWTQLVVTGRNLGSLLNPHSDVGLSKMSGVIGIMQMYHDEAQQGILPIMMFTILINVNLGILNLLPIPVLDGGQMVFATIAWIRGRSLPVNFIMATQSVFMVLILLVMVYIGYFDIMRIAHS